jgi:DNA-binding transcriptional ArsR family regulator
MDDHLNYRHPVDAGAVAVATNAVVSAADAGRMAGLLGLLSDPVRSRILMALGRVDRLCVGDLALVLEVSEDAVSYGLKLLRTAGLVVFEKEGRVVYYRLAPGFPHDLADHCLRQLLTIATEARP